MREDGCLAKGSGPEYCSLVFAVQTVNVQMSYLGNQKYTVVKEHSATVGITVSEPGSQRGPITSLNYLTYVPRESGGFDGLKIV